MISGSRDRKGSILCFTPKNKLCPHHYADRIQYFFFLIRYSIFFFGEHQLWILDYSHVNHFFLVLANNLYPFYFVFLKKNPILYVLNSVFSSAYYSVLCLSASHASPWNQPQTREALTATLCSMHSHCSQSISRTVTSHFVMRSVAVSILSWLLPTFLSGFHCFRWTFLTHTVVRD